MKLNKSIRTVLMVLLCLPMQVFSLSNDQNQPIYIEADSVEIDDRKGASIYTGNVDLTQGSIKINANKITVTQRSGQSDYVVAVGKPMHFKQIADNKKAVKGSASRMEYSVNSEIIYMSGNAKLDTGNTKFNSQKITYDRARAVVKAGAAAGAKDKKSGRVRMTITGGQ